MVYVKHDNKFFRGGGGVRRKILPERKMFVDTQINMCTHKK